MFENRVLKRIFGPKGEEAMGGWGKFYNKRGKVTGDWK
jgi:hypothetical protein